MLAFPTRHRCLGCGGSCHGVTFTLDAEERARITAYAQAMEIERPFVRDRLRLGLDGACVFLRDGRCRLHEEHGPAAKPRACRTYPLVVLDTEQGRRVGLDPGCYTAMRTVDSAEPLAVGPDSLVRELSFDPGARTQEEALVALLGRSPNATSALSALIGAPLRGAFALRWLANLRREEARAAVYLPELGSVVRSHLGHVFGLMSELPMPPEPVLPDVLDRWTLDVALRMVVLRLGPQPRNPLMTASLVLAGGMGIGWVSQGHRAYGQALAAWVRAIRHRPFARALFPTLKAFQFVMKGHR